MDSALKNLIQFLTDERILAPLMITQSLKAAGGVKATGESLVAQLETLLAPWSNDSLDFVLESHIRECARAIVDGKPIPQPGVRVGEWLLLKDLGEGGQGRLLVGIDYDATVQTDEPIRRAAIKFANMGDRRLHEREARLMVALEKRHCIGVPRAFSTGEINGQPYLAMELLAGKDLGAIVAKSGPMPVKSVVRVARRLIPILLTAHSAGFIHRDVKPSNVLSVGDPGSGDVYLIDWGLGKQLDETDRDDPFEVASELSQNNKLLGSLPYMAPEQLELGDGVELTTACDRYGFGALLFNLLTSEPPFRGGMQAQVKQIWFSTRRSVREVRAANLKLDRRGMRTAEREALQVPVPAELERLVTLLLGTEPEARPSLLDTRDALAAIENRLDGRPSTMPEFLVAAQPKPTAYGRGKQEPPKLVREGKSGLPKNAGARPASKPSPKKKKQAAKQIPSDSAEFENQADTKAGGTTTATEANKPNVSDTDGVANTSGFRLPTSTRARPMFVCDDPLDLAVGGGGIFNLTDESDMVAWPEGGDDCDVFLSSVNHDLLALANEAKARESQRLADLADAKLQVGNRRDAIAPLKLAWELQPFDRRRMQSLQEERMVHADETRSSMSKFFSSKAGLVPGRLRGVRSLLAKGRLIEAMRAADSCLETSPRDGRVLWLMAMAADLLESWSTCEYLLERIWRLPECGRANPVDVAAARVRFAATRREADHLSDNLADLNRILKEKKVDQTRIKAFMGELAAEVHGMRLETH